MREYFYNPCRECYTPDYDPLKCDNCGGTIIMGLNPLNRDQTLCNKCGKEFVLYKLTYDRLCINDKTGWIVPVVNRKEADT